MNHGFPAQAPTAAATWGATGQTTLRLLDRPTRSAFELARGPVSRTAIPAAIGFGLCTLSAALADVVSPGPGHALVGLLALLEALAVVVPTTLILGTYLGMRVSPRAFVAASALGLLTAGVVGLAMLPLFAFSVVAAAGELPRLAAPSLLVPLASAAGVVGVVVRVLRTTDATPAGRLVSTGFAVFFLGAFLLRFGALRLAAL